jgi:hypothetical protein
MCETELTQEIVRYEPVSHLDCLLGAFKPLILAGSALANAPASSGSLKNPNEPNELLSFNDLGSWGARSFRA